MVDRGRKALGSARLVIVELGLGEIGIGNIEGNALVDSNGFERTGIQKTSENGFADVS